ncbi:MAG: hypothetical protein ACLR4Z_05155 [Butyricicoccaceae bacterium]
MPRARRSACTSRQADVVIELGGEDAKIVFLTGQLEERMNGLLRRRHRRVHRPDGGPARRYPVRA